jgi:hypothetical protein
MTLTKTPEPPDLDALLKNALADDLPGEVERRLQRCLDSFLEARAGSRDAFLPPWALAFCSAFMIVAGVLLQVAGARSVFADSLLRLHSSLALSRAVAGSGSPTCALTPDGPAEELRSPAALADRVYRDWVLLRQEPTPEGDALVFFFRSGDGRAGYELKADRVSLRPRSLRRRTASGFDARCAWDAAAGEGPRR